jgi:hypothetical protein
MALIYPNNPIVSQSAECISDDYLKNLLINRGVVQKAIFELTKVGVKSYTLDTRQNSQTVTRQDLNSLRELLTSLNDLINGAEISKGVSGQLVQVLPW